MPAYPFRKEMVFPILLGTKPHTIRRRRKNCPTQPGDQIQMFVNWRTKNVVKFAVAPCIKVEPIIIYPQKMEFLKSNCEGVYIWQNWGEVDELASHDGFSGIAQFFEFFQNIYHEDMLDDFEIIHWDPQRVFVPPGVRMHRASHILPPKLKLSQWQREYCQASLSKMQAIADWEERRKR